MDSNEQENFMPEMRELREDEADSFGLPSCASDFGEQVAASASGSTCATPNMTELYPMGASTVRVRDIINMYNLATAKNQDPSQAKSVYLSGNKQGKLFETDGLSRRLGDESGSDVASTEVFNTDSRAGLKMHYGESIEYSPKTSSNSSLLGLTNINNCWESDVKLSEGSIGQQQAVKKCICSSCNSAQSNDKLKGAAIKITTSDGQASFKQQTGNATDSTSVYQSRTTIRKTDGGVRILIDIFFDNADGIDKISGNRVETSIPDSRILADFMQANTPRGGSEKR